jgi:hypothetical protein
VESNWVHSALRPPVTIVPAPGDYDDGEIGGMIGRGSRNTWRKPAPVPLCPPHPTCYPDANPSRRGGKPVTNRLTYGTALEAEFTSVPATDGK